MNFVTAWAFAASRCASAARVPAIASARRARIASQELTMTPATRTAKTAATPPTTALCRLANLPTLIDRARRPRDDGLVAQEAPDVLRHLCRRAVSARFVLLERLRDDGLDVAGQTARDAAQPRRLLFADDARHLRERLAVQIVRRAIGQQFVGDDAERVDVGSRVELIGLAGHLLRAHVGDGAHHLPRAGVHRRVQIGVDRARQAEVEHLRLARRDRRGCSPA